MERLDLNYNVFKDYKLIEIPVKTSDSNGKVFFYSRRSKDYLIKKYNSELQKMISQRKITKEGLQYPLEKFLACHEDMILISQNENKATEYLKKKLKLKEVKIA